MRPRKIVLVLDDDETRRRCRRFVFEIRAHCKVVSCRRMPINPGPKLTRLLREAEVCVAVGQRAEQFAADARGILPDIKLLIIPATKLSPESTIAAEAVLTAKTPMSDELELLQTLVHRKRGPKKRSGQITQRRRRLSDYGEFLDGFIAQRSDMQLNSGAVQ